MSEDKRAVLVNLGVDPTVDIDVEIIAQPVAEVEDSPPEPNRAFSFTMETPSPPSTDDEIVATDEISWVGQEVAAAKREEAADSDYVP